jgi:hypothetical protein
MFLDTEWTNCALLQLVYPSLGHVKKGISEVATLKSKSGVWGRSIVIWHVAFLNQLVVHVLYAYRFQYLANAFRCDSDQLLLALYQQHASETEGVDSELLTCLSENVALLFPGDKMEMFE